MKFSGIVFLLVLILDSVAVSICSGDRNLQYIHTNSAQTEPVNTEPVQVEPLQTETSAPVLHHCSSSSNCSKTQWPDGKKRFEATDDEGSYCAQMLSGPCEKLGDGILCTVNVCKELVQSCDFMMELIYEKLHVHDGYDFNIKVSVSVRLYTFLLSFNIIQNFIPGYHMLTPSYIF